MVRSASTKAESDQNGAVSEEQAGYGEEQAMVFPLSSLARVDVSERQNARTASVNGKLCATFPEVLLTVY